METSTGGGLKCSTLNANNNNVSSSMLKIRQFMPPSSPLNGNHNGLISPASHHEQLTELTSTDISLDLQGLIDDSQFGDENLFGDLIDGKKQDMINNNSMGYGLQQRTSPANSLGGSSGHSSPGEEGESYYPSRHALAYLPGSVHNGSYAQMSNAQIHPPQQQQPHQDIQVKQEPSESGEYNNNNGPPRQQYSVNNGQYSNGTVSSTTPSPPTNLYAGSGGVPIKTFSAPPGTTKYVHAANNNGLSPVLKKKPGGSPGCSDEYRRRRERNNVAVRKSREKAKLRTRETEERVKILARENERLQKKVELLQEELSVLRSLFSNVGVLPDHIHRELSKHMDSFQQQHNAMAAGGGGL